jgi:formylglycine-generating enzyme required for sulfatase activity
MGAAESPDMNMVGMQATTDSRPIHRVYVDGFWMDKTEVTNEQFAKFVEATGYVTIAERTPRAEDFPGAPPENLVAGAVVFSPPGHPVPLNDHLQWWSYVKHANWRHPEGPDSSITGREQYPVVQIAYDDAVAFAKWAGKRLPTEAEFEFAARGGLSGKLYAWGDEFTPHRQPMANTFQGHFPDKDTGEDGYDGIAPVARFAPNGYGLSDIAGNVWEWTSDWYRPDYYAQLASTGVVARNPRGPDAPFEQDPAAPVHELAPELGEALVGRPVQRRGGGLARFLRLDARPYVARYVVRFSVRVVRVIARLLGSTLTLDQGMAPRELAHGVLERGIEIEDLLGGRAAHHREFLLERVTCLDAARGRFREERIGRP